MKLTKYAQSTILIEDDGRRLLIDPGAYNFVPGRAKQGFFRNCDLLVITHVHSDHFDRDEVREIWRYSRPPIFTVREVAMLLADENIPATIIAPGEVVIEAGFRLTAVPTEHFLNGERVDAFGVVIESDTVRIYHASDTNYLEHKPYADVVLVPINNRGVSMNITEAARFVRDIGPKVAIPIHYDSPKDSHIDPKDFAQALEGSGVIVSILAFGETLDLASFDMG